MDRVWGVHRVGGNQTPLRLWDEKVDNGVLFAGHERWAYHAAGAVVVAYPSSPGRPRGLYYVDATSRSARLVSASNYDWHCNISRRGDWAVVDTAPAQEMRESDGRVISDIVLVNMASGQRTWIARSHADSRHPWHPHPHFSPDGKFIVYNDFDHDGHGSKPRAMIVELNV